MKALSADVPEVIASRFEPSRWRGKRSVRVLPRLADRFQANDEEVQWIKAHAVSEGSIHLGAAIQRRMALLDELSTLIQTIAVGLRAKKTGYLH